MKRLAIGILCGLLIAADKPVDPPTRADNHARLAAVRRFAYQLQSLDVKKAAASEAQLLVIDPQTDDGRLSADDIRTLQRMPDGSRRLVMAYLSIGEAENYRPYWKPAWTKTAPAWLGPENPDWKGNFRVHYWDKDWQSVILGDADASLDRILDVGFDGVYLDIVDGFEFWEERQVKDARTRMVNWVRRIADYARAKRASFLVIPQNGEALAAEPGYLDHVDALGREDLFFEGDKRHPTKDTRYVQKYIALFQQAKKPVLLIEYPTRPALQQEAYKTARESGYVPLVTVRDLDQLIVSKP